MFEHTTDIEDYNNGYDFQTFDTWRTGPLAIYRESWNSDTVAIDVWLFNRHIVHLTGRFFDWLRTYQKGA